jgi:hypothetical protein
MVDVPKHFMNASMTVSIGVVCANAAKTSDGTRPVAVVSD